MNKYIKFLYYIYLNKAVIPSSDTEVWWFTQRLRQEYVRVSVELYAHVALRKLLEEANK